MTDDLKHYRRKGLRIWLWAWLLVGPVACLVAINAASVAVVGAPDRWYLLTASSTAVGGAWYTWAVLWIRMVRRQK